MNTKKIISYIADCMTISSYFQFNPPANNKNKDIRFDVSATVCGSPVKDPLYTSTLKQPSQKTSTLVLDPKSTEKTFKATLHQSNAPHLPDKVMLILYYSCIEVQLTFILISQIVINQ